MRVYKAEPPGKKRKRRWLRVTLWTFGVLLILAVAAAGAVYYYLHGAYQQIVTPDKVIDKGASEQLAGALPTPKSPTTFLLIGADARPGDKYGRSDTLMLARLDPQKKIVTLLSMPRDWLVALPGYSRQGITNYYALGGPNLAIQAVAYATGIRPNYYARVDFKSFSRTVNAVGGTYIDVERRYYHINPGNAPGSAGDYMSIDIHPGYQKLGGASALAYVRYRHTDSDLYRLARQQRFMRALKHELDPSTLSTNLITLINIAKDDVKIIGRKPMGEDQLMSYMNLLRQIDMNNVISIRLQGSADAYQPGRIDISDSEVAAARSAFENPDPTQAMRAAQQATGQRVKSGPGIDPSKITVEVRNGNGQLGAAANAQSELNQASWTKATANGDADVATYFKSEIYYRPNDATALAAAKKLSAAVQPSDTAPLTSAVIARLNTTHWKVQDASQVVLVIGSTFDQVVKPAVRPLPPRLKAEVTSNPTRDLSDWKSAEHHSRLQLMMPTVLPTGAVTGDPEFPAYPHFHIYGLHGGGALHVTYYLPSNPGATAFGIQALKWSNPPILDAPNGTKVQNGITYRLYLNGAAIDRIAWTANGTTMWLSNTLGESLSNSTMWAIARSVRSVR